MTDLTDLAIVLGKQNKENRRLIEALIKMIGDIQPQDVSVNLDLERVVKAIPKPVEQKAPIVNMDLSHLKQPAKTEPLPYKFDIKRDGHGRINQVLATPIGEIK